MNSFLKKQSKLLRKMVVFCFVFAFSFNAFATSLDVADVIIGPNSSEPDSILLDDENYALESLSKVMNTHDLMLAAVYISDYRRGDKRAENDLKALISKYDIPNVNQIMNYILQDHKVRLLASYVIDHTTNSLAFTPVNGLVDSVDANTTLMATFLWNEIVKLAPPEFTNNINVMHLELNKDNDTMATMCAVSTDASKWDINLDIRLLDPDKTEEITKNIIYLTTFYYILRTDQIEFLSPKKDNYSYAGNTYRDNSYINIFYRRFWKGRRKEINLSQYDIYKNEFLNSKASRTVYDDMAVSFYNYVNVGIMRRYLGFRADKTNFFHEYPFFKDLAKQFRYKLGILIS